MAVSQREPVISHPTIEDLYFLVLNLRSSDHEETFDTLLLDPVDPVDHLVDHIWRSCDLAVFCELYSDPHSGKPFALAFINRVTLTGAAFNFLCTPAVTVHMGWLTRQVLGRLQGVMDACELRRVECRARSIGSHIRWLQAIGANVECTVPGFSKHEFTQVAWANGGQN